MNDNTDFYRMHQVVDIIDESIEHCEDFEEDNSEQHPRNDCEPGMIPLFRTNK